MPETREDLLADITTKTTKDELMKRLKRAAKIIRSQDEQQVERLQEIEQRVRAKVRPGYQPEVKSVLVTATEEEFEELDEFLKDFEDLLPVGLLRLRVGFQALKDGKATA